MTEFRVGNGYDVHRLAEDIPMRLCGVDVDSPRGFVAHSDGDVAIHALCDAILGAAALGDIGGHFPDNSSEFKGIDSRELLKRTVGLLNEMPGGKWDVVNADITIALQEPKIAPYIQEMRRSIASLLDIGICRVSVKATTTERLGFVGRGEGCEVWATVLLGR